MDQLRAALEELSTVVEQLASLVAGIAGGGASDLPKPAPLAPAVDGNTTQTDTTQGAGPLPGAATAGSGSMSIDGGAVIEAESLQAPSGWARGNAYGSDGYIYWSGANMKSSPGTAAIPIAVSTAQGGSFRFDVLGLKDGDANDAENDVFVRSMAVSGRR